MEVVGKQGHEHHNPATAKIEERLDALQKQVNSLEERLVLHVLATRSPSVDVEAKSKADK